MWSSILLLLSASSFAQEAQPPPLPSAASAVGEPCTFSAPIVTCACRKGHEVLNLTNAFIKDGTQAETLAISGCTSVTFAFKPLPVLRRLSVTNTGNATFQGEVSQLLQQLALVNVSQVMLQGPIFQDSALEKVLLDGVHVSTLPRDAFAGLSKLRNLTFRDVHINAVEENAVRVQMVNKSNFIILNSELLGVQRSGIVLKGVANFTMHESHLTSEGDDALQLESTGSISISDSYLKSVGPLKLSFPPGSSFRFVNNVWSGASVIGMAQQFLLSKAIPEVAGNKFHCTCDPIVANIASHFTDLPQAALLLDRNECDAGICEWPAPLRVITKCHNETTRQAACRDMAPTPATANADTVNAKHSTPSAITQSPRLAKPLNPGTKSTASAIAISFAMALLLTVPAAAALSL